MLRAARGHIILNRVHYFRRQSEVLVRYNNRMLLQRSNTILHLDCIFSFYSITSTESCTSLQEWMTPSRRLRLLKKC